MKPNVVVPAAGSAPLWDALVTVTVEPLGLKVPGARSGNERLFGAE